MIYPGSLGQTMQLKSYVYNKDRTFGKLVYSYTDSSIGICMYDTMVLFLQTNLDFKILKKMFTPQ